MSLSVKILRNTLANYGGNGVTLAVAFLLTPFLIHSLGDTSYGAWVLVGSISSYFWMFDFGLGASVIKFVSELKVTDNHEKLNSVVTNSCVLLAIVGLASLLGCILLAQLVESVFRLPSDLVPQVRAMIYITGVSLGLSFPFGVFGGVLRGYQRYDLVNAVGAVSMVVNAAMSVGVVVLQLGIVGLAVASLITNILVAVGRVVMAARVAPSLKPRLSQVRLSSIGEIASFSAWVFVINVAVQVVYRTAPVIIAVLLDVALVTPYSIASGLTQYLRRFVDPILAVLLPAYAELCALDESDRLRSLLIDGSRLVAAISLPLVMVLILLGDPFIRLWVGPGYHQAYQLLCLLSVPTFISFLVATGDKLLWARGKIRVNSLVAVADSAINLTLSLLLTNSLGVVGVGLAPLISVVTTNAFVLLPYICRVAGVPFSSYLAEVAKPVLLPVVPSGGLALLLLSLIGADSYLSVALVGAVCALSYWASFILMSRREEKARWVAVIRTALIPERIRRAGGLA